MISPLFLYFSSLSPLFLYFSSLSPLFLYFSSLSPLFLYFSSLSPLFLYFSSLSPLFLYFSSLSPIPILISGSQESAVDVSAEIAEQLQLAETQLSSVKSEQDQLKASLAAMTEERDSMSEKVMNFFNPNGIIFFRLFLNLSSLFFFSFMSQFALCTRREKGII